MSISIIEERLRQLLAVDKNALDIYTDLQRIIEDPAVKEQIASIVKDEARHVALEKELLSLIRD